MSALALVKAAQAAWADYASAARFGGTDDQRASAFRRALHAEEKLRASDWVAERTAGPYVRLGKRATEVVR